MSILRIDKFLSEMTRCSRNEIKDAVRRGELTVNGLTVKKPDSKIDSEKDKIVFLGKEINYKKFVYLMLNKPEGVLSASNDKSRKTVVDLLPEEYGNYELFPVGRLDKDTTGLLLITNDGNFAHKVISPKSLIEKSYLVKVDGQVPEDISRKFSQGIILADGTKCASAVAEVLGDNLLRIIITEGKYHQIKRMLGVVNLGVVELHRERIGNLSLKSDLECGQVCELDIDEIKKISPFLP